MHSTHTSESGRMDPRGLFKDTLEGPLSPSRRRGSHRYTALTFGGQIRHFCTDLKTGARGRTKPV